VRPFLLLTDDFNNRVIVIDPRNNRVVWQGGKTERQAARRATSTVRTASTSSNRRPYWLASTPGFGSALTSQSPNTPGVVAAGQVASVAW
jgi:hypothetical protein